MAHEVETMFSARELPWHGLGTVTEDTLSAKEALVAAGLDWNVDLRPAYFTANDGEMQKAPDVFLIVRDSDDAVLGKSGSHYEPFQNHEGFEFLDNLVDEGLAYETAGSLRSGQIVFITAKVPEQVLIGGEDAHEVYLFARLGHTGRDGITIGVTPVRIVCMNTMNLGLQRARRTWRVSHTKTVRGRLAEARRALDLTWQYVDNFKVEAEELLASPFSDREFDRFLTELVGDKQEAENRPSVARARDGISTIYHESPTTEGIRGSKWGAVNAVGEFFDWEREIRSEEARLLGSIDGTARKHRDKALALVTA